MSGGNAREKLVEGRQGTRRGVRGDGEGARRRPVRGRLPLGGPGAHAPAPGAGGERPGGTVDVAHEARDGDGVGEVCRARVLEVVGAGLRLRTPHERGRRLAAHASLGGARAPLAGGGGTVVEGRRGGKGCREGRGCEREESVSMHGEFSYLGVVAVEFSIFSVMKTA